MTRWLLACLLFAGAALAQDVRTSQPGNFSAGGGTGTYRAAGIVSATLTSTGNGADASEDTLQTFTLPANSFNTNGQCVYMRTWGTLAANGDTKTIKIYFGATSVSSGGVTTSNVNWQAEMFTCRTGSGTQTYRAIITINTAIIINQTGSISTTDTAGIIIKTTGQSGSSVANDVVASAMIVEFQG